MHNSEPVDSLIFDMDGTLWDAVDSYTTIWNITLDEVGIEHHTVTRPELIKLMGAYLDDILAQLVPESGQRRMLLERVMQNEADMMPELGGILYPGVKEGLFKLTKNYRLFMVSNCGAKGLENFVKYNGLEGCFIDLLSHGSTGKSKADNICTLIERYDLKSPVYVGDTQSDADNAHKAGIPIVWTAYGFGNVVNADETIHSFGELPQAIKNLNDKRNNYAENRDI